MDPYDSLQPANIGGAFNDAWDRGWKMRQEVETRNALAKYALDPNNPEAMQGLAKFNPEMAIQLQQQKRQEAMRGLEAHRDNILKGAQIIRQLGVKDQAGWDQARALAGQMGIDLSEVPAEFNPQYVQGMTALADAFGKQGQQGTAMQQNYEFLQKQNPDLAQSYLKNQAEGAPLIASNGDGTFTIIPRGMANGQQLGPPAPPNVTFTPIDGGPTPPASGNFPR